MSIPVVLYCRSGAFRSEHCWRHTRRQEITVQELKSDLEKSVSGKPVHPVAAGVSFRGPRPPPPKKMVGCPVGFLFEATQNKLVPTSKRFQLPEEDEPATHVLLSTSGRLHQITDAMEQRHGITGRPSSAQTWAFGPAEKNRSSAASDRGWSCPKQKLRSTYWWCPFERSKVEIKLLVST